MVVAVLILVSVWRSPGGLWTPRVGRWARWVSRRASAVRPFTCCAPGPWPRARRRFLSPAPGGAALSPTRISQQVREQAVQVRAALEEASGLDHGPVSVHDRIASMGLASPSPASLARIFRAEGVARAEPRKRPRSAWRRFVYPAPNACWQPGATEVRACRRVHGRHLPAAGRPLASGGRLPGRPGRDQPGRDLGSSTRAWQPGACPSGC